MPYEPNLDKVLFSKVWENEDERITVSVRSYNEGEKKLQIARENRNRDGELRFTKLGRLTKPEVEGIVPFIQEAIQNM